MKDLIWFLSLFLSVILCQGQLKRVLLKQASALCLDGTPGAYYIGKGQDTKTIVLYFEGGGWCGQKDLSSTIQSCYQRSKTDYGSSKLYPPTVTYSDGILSQKQNNHFRKATRIILRYCDGSGHQGTRTLPIVYKDAKLYFRGNNITIAQLQDIQSKQGLFSKAQNIIVTGGSAGGLAVFLWTDYIKKRAKAQFVYAVPDSGIFLDSPTFDTHQNAYSTQFMNLFKLSNSQINPPIEKCVQKYPQAIYKCMMAEYMVQFIETPLFAIQSLYDSWAIPNILNINCIKGNSLESCSTQQRQYIQQYRKNTSEVLNKITNKDINGIWAPACATHGFLHAARYNNQKYRVPMNSDNSIDQSLIQWINNTNSTHMLIDQDLWPSNRPCSGLSILSTQ